MKATKFILAMLLLGTAGVMSNAWADHGGHVRFGVVIDPFGGPWYYPPPSYYYPPYYPPVIVERTGPPVYIEQQTPATAPPANYWYYCAPTKGYYPYVKECPAGWQRVSPQPPAQP